MDHNVGRRFSPDNKELINYYMRLKLLGLDEDVDDMITEVDFFKHEPWDLLLRHLFILREVTINGNDQVWYFIYKLDRYSNGTQVKRKTRTGYKVTSKYCIVFNRNSTKEIGIKKILTYYIGRVSEGVKTNWIIHEYHPT
ncbi:LOW QUALITY PROTEIN: NAM domain-containing protein, partial [Cephalotus follicularis]